MSDIGAAAITTGSNIISDIFNMGSAESNRRKQVKSQKELTKFNADQQLRLFEETGYGAQVRQMENAGLNPGLIYSQGGRGGDSSLNASSGVDVPYVEKTNMMDIALKSAQVEMLKSQAEKNIADAEKTKGVDTDEGKARIENLQQGVKTAKAQEAWLKVETDLKAIEQYEKIASQEDRLDYIKYYTKQALHNAKIAENEEWLSSETKKNKRDIIRAIAIQGFLQNELTKENITKTKEEVREITNRINQKWMEIRQTANKMDIEKFKAEIEAEFPTTGKAIGKALTEIYDLFGGDRDENERVRTVDKKDW